MVKKKDWKYTIVRQFIKDIQEPYDKFTNRLVYLFKEENKDSNVVLSDFRFESYIYDILELINDENDVKDLSEFMEFLKEKDNYRNRKNIINGSMYDKLQKLYYARSKFKLDTNDYNYILDLKNKLNKYSGKEILDKANIYDIIDKTLLIRRYYKSSKIFSDLDKYESDFKIKFNSFHNYDLLESFAKNTFLSFIIKGSFNKGRINFYNYEIDDNLEVKCQSYIKLDDGELNKLRNEISEIYKSYQYLLDKLKEKSVKSFTEFVEVELPKLKLEKYETNINDIIDKNHIESNEMLYKSLKKLDKIAMNLV